MLILKIIFTLFMVGGYVGACMRASNGDNKGFWHETIKFTIFVILVAERWFF